MFRDWKQTNEMVNRRKEGYYEKDNERILGKYPSHEKINIYYLTALSSSIALACWLDDPWRKIFLGGGRFTQTDVIRTGKLLAIFALAIPAESFIHLLVRAFYALKDTWTPILVSIPGLLLIISLSKILIPTLSLNALALSYSIGVTLEALILFLILRKKLASLG